MNVQLLINPNWLSSIRELFSYFTGDDLQTIKIFTSAIISIFIPIISLFFLKSVIDYVDPDKLDNVKIKGSQELETQELQKNETNEIVNSDSRDKEIEQLKVALKKSEDEKEAKTLWIQELNETIDKTQSVIDTLQFSNDQKSLEKENIKNEEIFIPETVNFDDNYQEDKIDKENLRNNIINKENIINKQNIYNIDNAMNPAIMQNNNIK